MSAPEGRATAALPPLAERRPVHSRVHGVERVDDYAWMRAKNWQAVLADPAKLPADIRAHLEAENAYAQHMLAPTLPLQAALLAELRGRIKEEDAQAPVPDGPFEYFERYQEGGEHELICRRPRGGGPETLLLDGDGIGRDKSFFELGAAEHSPDHNLLAWSFDANGSELYAIRVRECGAATDLKGVVRRTDGTILWSADSRAFHYVRVDDNHRTAQVFLHRLGTDQKADTLVAQDMDPGWFVGLRRSDSRQFGIVSMSDHDASEEWLIDLADPAQPARLIAARAPGLRYFAQHDGDRLFIRANSDGAEDFKIVEAPLHAPQQQNWRDLVPHRRGVMIAAMAVFAGHLVRLEQHNGLPRIIVRDIASGDEHEIEFAEEAYALSIADGHEFDAHILRFAYSSMTTPDEIYDYDMVTRERVLRKRQEIPSGHDPARYVSRRIFARAADGAEVPISILARADIVGPAPCLLHAYGAYGDETPADFDADRFSLVDRGFVYAIAHVRGGTDKGWNWYESGKLARKPNSFTDFIACAQLLIADKWTDKGRIVAQGGSAGGLLVGAVANMAPDLFAGVIADVPFVDVVNTMLDKDLPLTPQEWLEWGNPIEDAQAFSTMLSYSPYDNVAAQAYPPMLVLAGLCDPRVTYWEPAKWVARLRERTTGGAPILLHTDMDAGHGGASGRFHALREIALQYAFALRAVGDGFESA